MIKALEARLSRVLDALEAMRPQHFIICTKGGRAHATTLLAAIKDGAQFVRTVDGKTDLDELYRALLNTDPAALEGVAEE